MKYISFLRKNDVAKVFQDFNGIRIFGLRFIKVMIIPRYDAISNDHSMCLSHVVMKP